jgi:putative addiction module component (TIGR02574 family)
VGRSNETHIDADDDFTADAAELALLKDVKQVRLHRRRHIAHLVEEERAAMGQFEQAALSPDRARERARLVAEQLRGQKTFGEGSTALGDKYGRARWHASSVLGVVDDQELASAHLCRACSPRYAPGVMIDTDAAELLERALALPVHTRLALADELLDSVEGAPDPEWTKAWAEELHGRVAELDSGAVTGIPADVALERVRATLRQR